MIKGIESVVLFSEKPKALADFYKDKVGLKLTLEAEIGEGEELFGFDFGGSSVGLYINHHSEIKGKTKDPKRIMFNLEVDNIESEVKILEKKGLKMIGMLHQVEGYGKIATFEDIDGNFFQLVQTRES